MKDVQKEKMGNIKEILQECRRKGVTVEDLLEVISVAIDSKETIGEEEIETIDKENIEVRVSNLLKEIGIPAHIKGYRYLRYSIIYALENFDALDMVMKVLYPAVAKEFNTTSSRVERAIRHAIEVAWDRGDVDVLQEYFGYTIQSKRGKPTNSEFIAMLVDKLQLES